MQRTLTQKFGFQYLCTEVGKQTFHTWLNPQVSHSSKSRDSQSLLAICYTPSDSQMYSPSLLLVFISKYNVPVCDSLF